MSSVPLPTGKVPPRELPTERVHDLGGRVSGSVPHDRDEPTFHADWERKVFGMLLPVLSNIKTTPGEFRHALERLAPVDYFENGYYGRWLAGLELLAVEHGLVPAAAIASGAPQRAATTYGPTDFDTASAVAGDPVPHAGARRSIDVPPQFAVGDRVVITAADHDGHSRRGAYAVGVPGTVIEVHPAEVLPDPSAHRLAEHACWVYAVGFSALDLWGDDGEPNTTIMIDAYEPYLEPVMCQ